MFGQIPVVEREGSFGRIGAPVPGSQHPGCEISESYRGTLHLSDRPTQCTYQPVSAGCDNTCTDAAAREPVLLIQ
jgi:hypothetical protein